MLSIAGLRLRWEERSGRAEAGSWKQRAVSSLVGLTNSKYCWDRGQKGLATALAAYQTCGIALVDADTVGGWLHPALRRSGRPAIAGTAASCLWTASFTERAFHQTPTTIRSTGAPRSSGLSTAIASRDRHSGIVNDLNAWFDDPRDLLPLIRRIRPHKCAYGGNRRDSAAASERRAITKHRASDRADTVPGDQARVCVTVQNVDIT